MNKLTNNVSTKWLWAVVPLVILAGLIWLLFQLDILDSLTASSPPVAELTVERTILDEDGFELVVRANGSEPVDIAQVMVNSAYLHFTQEPSGPLGRLETARISIPYHWVKGEPYEITFVTDIGATFTHSIEVAMPTPGLTLSRLAVYALIGIFVGVIPVILGMLFFPFLKTLSDRGYQFILSLTIGLLVFLLIDTLMEGLELGAMAAGAFEGQALVWLAALISFLVIFALGRYNGAPEGFRLAFYLALGIGLHNLGEGLAIGAAYVSGAAALGTFLIVGFMLHNITEGIGIAAPLVDKKPSLLSFAGLAALAGLPAIAGTWAGAYAYSPHWAALLMGVGAGAILQVIVEVGAYLAKQGQKQKQVFLSAASISGFAIGILVMYVTALFVSV